MVFFVKLSKPGSCAMKEKVPINDIKRLIKEYEQDICEFLQDLVRIASPSTKERLVAERILEEMKRLEFDQAWIDDIGNIIGRMGKKSDECNVVYDGHIDTVATGDPEQWKYPPLSAEVADGYVWGRGAADNKNAVAVQVYGAFIAKKIWGSSLPATIYVTGSIMEEDCDGLALEHAIRESIAHPIHAVIIGEATNCRIYRGHRGRIECYVETQGTSAHASAPQRGDNAVYKMGDIIIEVEDHDNRLAIDPFLGKGTIALTKIECETDSLNCVPYLCRIYLDRRLTAGEDRTLALEQIEQMASYKAANAQVQVLQYEATTWKNKTLRSEKYFPTWTLEEDHPLVRAAVSAYSTMFDKAPEIGKWDFSTNGIATMGRLGIPTIGFGPGDEQYAHVTDERLPLEQLPTATTFYAALPYYIPGGLPGTKEQ